MVPNIQQLSLVTVSVFFSQLNRSVPPEQIMSANTSNTKPGADEANESNVAPSKKIEKNKIPMTKKDPKTKRNTTSSSNKKNDAPFVDPVDMLFE